MYSVTVCLSLVFHFQFTIVPFLIVSLPLLKKSSERCVTFTGGAFAASAIVTGTARTASRATSALENRCFRVGPKDRLQRFDDLTLRGVRTRAVEKRIHEV